MKNELKTLLASFYLLTSTFVMAQKYETQSYDVIKNIAPAEVRYYPPAMKIVADDANGFRQLFGFISGNNSENQKIAMTTPVYRGTTNGKKTMAFVLPKSFTTKNTPRATSKTVAVVAAPSGYFLAYAYGGYTSASKEQLALEKLNSIAQEQNLKIIGAPQWLFYNAPYQFWNRKNELLLEIQAPR